MQDDGLEDITLRIPYPSHIPRARGIHAVGKFGTMFKVLCSKSDAEVLDQAAAHIGITKSELVRWATVHVSREVMRNAVRKDAD